MLNRVRILMSAFSEVKDRGPSYSFICPRPAMTSHSSKTCTHSLLDGIGSPRNPIPVTHLEFIVIESHL